ncbi:MAG TPA: NusG domain II-containing protein [Lachnospiraceae bacterium]|nr:NusG domain II-containing protein [Lachnospiraceae bacterium]
MGKGVRKPDIAIIAIIAAVAFALSAFFAVYDTHRIATEETGRKRLIITKDGDVTGSYALDEDILINVGEANVCEIKDGHAYMKSADCPDQSCVRSHPISDTGENIVCLPNKVVLKIETDKAPAEDVPDAVTY